MKLGRSTLVAALAAMVFAGLSGAAQAGICITEVHPSGSGNSTYQADWFELTNTGAAAVDITGWKFDDSSNLFSSAVALRGVTSISPGESVVFAESNASGTNDAGIMTNFINAWFNGSAPSGFNLGFYGGSGVGLSTTSDAVNVFDAGGVSITGVTFGASTSGISFDNQACLTGAISTLSAVGVNGAFNSVTGGEIGSPGVTPEPTTLGLLSLGVFALIRRR